MSEIKQVIFKLNNQEYGLDIMNVNAIEKHASIARIPNVSKHIQGIINLRGDVIPVYSLRIKFGLPETMVDDNAKLIITKADGILVAFEVDSVVEIIEIPEVDVLDPPNIIKTGNTEYIDKVANIDGRMILLLDLSGILSSKEKEHIEEITSI